MKKYVVQDLFLKVTNELQKNPLFSYFQSVEYFFPLISFALSGQNLRGLALTIKKILFPTSLSRPHYTPSITPPPP